MWADFFIFKNKTMKRVFVSVVTILLAAITMSQEIMEVFAGKVDRYDSMPSQFVEARHVDVWLPEGYDKSRREGYPVIYMHDGQNLFNRNFGYGGMTWGVDEVLTMLQRLDRIEPCIVVGVWNTSKRWLEYMPEKPYHSLDDDLKKRIRESQKGEPVSDDYLKFLVKELKPMVDEKYNTRPGKASTCIMGSSMGGLISWYAACEYPDVFGAAGCLSTHWPGSISDIDERIPQSFTDYIRKNLKAENGQKIYFDYGTETLDASYEPYQLKVDKVMKQNGFVEGKNWLTKKYPGHDHSEISWNKRLHVSVLFLMEKNNIFRKK